MRLDFINSKEFFYMKTKLLLFAVLCALQCGLTVFAAEEKQPEKPNRIAAWCRKKAKALHNALHHEHPLHAERDEQIFQTQPIPVQPMTAQMHSETTPFGNKPDAYRRDNAIYSIQGELLTKVDDLLCSDLNYDQDLFKCMARAFVLINHPRCGAQSPFYGLPADIVQQICIELKKRVGFPCKLCKYFVGFTGESLYSHYRLSHLPQQLPDAYEQTIVAC